ncbi:MAG: 16S rRNA (cytosine(967)-C(5))-methyltransferase RsmB [Tissierellia bacterium]|nr:16S rRNA (cytosine(967)-C(5))-methyltransferase RsmB [Tissierellia bacterium]
MLKPVRQLALEIVSKTLAGGFAKDFIQEVDRRRYKEEDLGLLQEIVFGTLQHHLYLSAVLDKFIREEPGKKPVDPDLRLLLETALYQIHFLDRVPNFAVVNESVNLAKKIHGYPAGSLVNGILRSILRDPKAFEIEEPHLRYSMPLEWLEVLKEDLPEDWEEFLKASTQRAPFQIRSTKRDREQLAAALQRAGYATEKTEHAPQGLTVKNPRGIFETRFFTDGYFYVQDEASQLVPELFTPDPKAKALDLCAAPGGKAMALATSHQSVVANDISSERLKQVKENKKRLGLQNIRTSRSKGEEFSLFGEKFDHILVDAPCSGLGLLRKKPEIKYHTSPQDASQLSKIQLNLLNASVKHLKEQGEIVYSTCTVTRRENEDVVQSFLEEHEDFTLAEERRYFPHREGTDGFYMAKLVRKS